MFRTPLPKSIVTLVAAAFGGDDAQREMGVVRLDDGKRCADALVESKYQAVV